MLMQVICVPVVRRRGEEHVVGPVRARQQHRQRQQQRQPRLPPPPPRAPLVPGSGARVLPRHSNCDYTRHAARETTEEARPRPSAAADARALPYLATEHWMLRRAVSSTTLLTWPAARGPYCGGYKGRFPRIDR